MAATFRIVLETLTVRTGVSNQNSYWYLVALSIHWNTRKIVYKLAFASPPSLCYSLCNSNYVTVHNRTKHADILRGKVMEMFPVLPEPIFQSRSFSKCPKFQLSPFLPCFERVLFSIEGMKPNSLNRTKARLLT